MALQLMTRAYRRVGDRSHSMSGKEEKSLHVLSLGAFFLLLLVNLRA